MELALRGKIALVTGASYITGTTLKVDGGLARCI
jgi:NAD(P)-dependent dehydrogenase (short-subunit alcohol dehydrogenase family)